MATAAELAIILSAKDRASGQFRKLQKQLTAVQKSASTMGKSFKVLTPVLGTASGGLGGAVLSAGFGFNIMKENAQLAFTQLLKDGGKATAMISEIETIAKSTPFQFEDLVRGSQRMLAFGFAAGEVLPTLTTIGDAVSAMGGGADMLDRVTVAFGQMHAKGKVSAEEMLQLTEAGIPAWQILAENVEQISPRLAEAARAGKITQQQVVSSLMKMGEQGKLKSGPALAALRAGMASRFGGLGKKAGEETTGGAFSNLIDSFTQLAGKITEGPFKEAAGILRTVAGALDKMKEGFKDLSPEMQTLVGWLGSFVLAGATVVGAIVGAGGLLWALGAPGLLGTLGTVSAKFATLAAAGGPIALAAVALGGLKLAWDKDFLGMRTQLDPLFEKLGSLGGVLRGFVAGNPFAVSVALGFAIAKKLVGPIWEWLTGQIPGLQPAVNLALEWAAGLASSIGGWLSGTGSALTRYIAAQVVWVGATATAIGTWIEGTGSALQRNLEAFVLWGGETATSIGAWLAGTGSALQRNIEAFVLWAGSTATSIGTWLEGVGPAIGRNIEAFVLWAGETAGALGEWFEGTGGAIGRNIEAFVWWAGETASRIGEWFAGVGGALGRNVEVYLGWAGNLASTIGSWLADGNFLSRTVQIGLSWASEWVKKILDWIAGGASIGGGALGSAAPAQAWVDGVPQLASGGLITSAGLAMLHAGETVVPAGRGGGNTYHFNNYGVLAGHDAEAWVRSILDRTAARGGSS